MNKNVIEDLVKISELNARDKYEIDRITYENKYLVPCKAEIKDEEVKFIYNLENLKPLKEILDEGSSEKIRFLANVSELLDLAEIYCFSLESSNLYYDYNYNPKVLRRDVRNEDSILDREGIAAQYKSLIGTLFIKKRSYDDFYNGGIKLLKSHKITKKYIELGSVEDIKAKLLEDLKDTETYDKENFIKVKKNDYKFKKHGIRIVSLVTLGLAAYSVYTGVFVNPFNQNVIKGNYSYMEQDYEGVIKSLEKAKNIKFMNLDKNCKYELAYSYIISENLSESQRKNVLLNLTSKSDENILDYWITLGEVKYDDAIDLAKKLQDNELLLYALLNKDKYIQDDTTMSGEEKEKAQQSIKSEIDKLTEQLNKDDREAVQGDLNDGISTQEGVNDTSQGTAQSETGQAGADVSKAEGENGQSSGEQGIAAQSQNGQARANQGTSQNGSGQASLEGQSSGSESTGLNLVPSGN